MHDLSIAVFSDVICPWCYLGKRRLERALDELRVRESTAISWLPFELNPDMPADGMPRSSYRAAKFGAQKSAMLDQQMVALGQDEGIAFAFDRQPRTPNTRQAHMLIAQAAQAGKADAVVEALFRAYFEEGRDVGKADVLIAIAERAGLGRDTTMAALEEPGLREQVQDLERQAGQMGVAGVPFFIVNGTWVVSGAQPTARWLDALREVATRSTEAGQRPPAP